MTLALSVTALAAAVLVLSECSFSADRSVTNSAVANEAREVRVAGTTDLRRVPIVPKISGSVKANVKKVYGRGQQLGNDPAVFAKAGDSITATQAYLYSFACDEERMGRFSYLDETIDFFKSKRFPTSYTSVWCEKANSFSRDSVAAESGVTSEYPISKLGFSVSGCSRGSDTYLSCEFRRIKPSFVIVMYGTNDITFNIGRTTYRRNLSSIVKKSTEAGVIPILSTIPPRLDSKSQGRRVTPFNRVVLSVARKYKVPLVNYWRALNRSQMVNKGMSDDGVHPNLLGNCDPECLGYEFTTNGLRYGFNQRNLTTLKTLAVVRKALT